MMKSVDKYRFLHALRPFSFTVALVICLTGLLAAWVEGYHSPMLAGITLLSALFLQAGVNLINDYTDLPLLQGAGLATVRLKVRQNFFVGLGCILLATALCLFLIAQSGIELLWLSLLGLAGALGYTLEPVNYKRRGLGVVLVFFFMGALMVEGAYFILAEQFSWRVLWLSLPVSVLTSLLLLSNELRDYEADQRAGIKTLTVRIGFPLASTIYKVALLSNYLLVVVYSLSGFLPAAWWCLFSIPLLLKLWPMLGKAEGERAPLTPWTGRLFLLFGLLYCLAIICG